MKKLFAILVLSTFIGFIGNGLIAHAASNFAPVVITEPNGGVFTTGNTMKIAWTGGDPSQPISVYLVNDTQSQKLVFIVANLIISDQQTIWKIPDTVATGKYYIYITSGYGSDFSDNLIAITTPTTQSSSFVTAVNGLLQTTINTITGIFVRPAATSVSPATSTACDPATDPKCATTYNATGGTVTTTSTCDPTMVKCTTYTTTVTGSTDPTMARLSTGTRINTGTPFDATPSKTVAKNADFWVHLNPFGAKTTTTTRTATGNLKTAITLKIDPTQLQSGSTATDTVYYSYNGAIPLLDGSCNGTEYNYQGIVLHSTKEPIPTPKYGETIVIPNVKFSDYPEIGMLPPDNQVSVQVVCTDQQRNRVASNFAIFTRTASEAFRQAVPGSGSPSTVAAPAAAVPATGTAVILQDTTTAAGTTTRIASANPANVPTTISTGVTATKMTPLYLKIDPSEMQSGVDNPATVYYTYTGTVPLKDGTCNGAEYNYQGTLLHSTDKPMQTPQIGETVVFSNVYLADYPEIGLTPPDNQVYGQISCIDMNGNTVLSNPATFTRTVGGAATQAATTPATSTSAVTRAGVTVYSDLLQQANQMVQSVLNLLR